MYWKCNWLDEMILFLLFAYWTSRQSIIQIILFYLIYERQGKLPLDVKRNDKQKNPTLLNRVNHLINELSQVHADVKEQIRKKQQKQKDHHDRKIIKNNSLEIGDKVLLYNAAKEQQWFGKLEPKWKGPYYIHQILLNEAYKLRTLDSKVFKTLIM